ncbi:MAG: class I SAM-dependent methyltransferase, partial [Desulfuromonadaceae bacterium]
MSSAFKDHFSSVAEAYRSFRPEYPEELFQWLAEVAPRQLSALDCGCGTGQATRALARYFSQVYGLDPSPEQIKQNAPE